MPQPLEDIHILPAHEGVSIHFGDIKEVTETSITFDGYFRAEPELLPIRRIFVWGSGPTQKWLLVSIDSMEQIEDTSKGWYDEEMGGYIVLTPTALIKITYTTIQTLDSPQETERIHNELQEELRTERERNAKLEYEKHVRDMEAASQISYKDILDRLHR
jgi:hypothetical protein